MNSTWKLSFLNIPWLSIRRISSENNKLKTNDIHLHRTFDEAKQSNRHKLHKKKRSFIHNYYYHNYVLAIANAYSVLRQIEIIYQWIHESTQLVFVTLGNAIAMHSYNWTQAVHIVKPVVIVFTHCFQFWQTSKNNATKIEWCSCSFVVT